MFRKLWGRKALCPALARDGGVGSKSGEGPGTAGCLCAAVIVALGLAGVNCQVLKVSTETSRGPGGQSRLQLKHFLLYFPAAVR